MIQQITDVAPGTAAFKLAGEVTKSDYDTVVIPGVDKLAETNDTINFMLVIETDLSNFTIGAWLQDAWVGLKHFSKIRKVAVVSDSDIEEKMTAFADTLVPKVEFRSFTLAEQSAARAWLGSIGSR